MFSMGDLDLGKDIRDPFLLNPEGSYTNEQKKLSSDVFKISKPVSYTHLTLPTIYSV